MSTPIERAADVLGTPGSFTVARDALAAALDVDELAFVLHADDVQHHRTEYPFEDMSHIYVDEANAVVAHLLGQYDFFQHEPHISGGAP